MEKICIVRRRRTGLESSAVPRIEFSEEAHPQVVTIELTPRQSEVVCSNGRFQELYGGSNAPVFLNVHLDATLPTRLLKTEDVCKLLQVSKQTVERLVRAGTIRSHKVGRLRRFSPQDILEFLSSGFEIGRLRSLHTNTLVSSEGK